MIGKGRNYILQRTSAQANFMILQLDTPNSSVDYLFEERRDYIVNSCTLMGLTSATEVVNSKDLKVIRVERVEHDGEKMIAVTFKYAPRAPDKLGISGE